MEIDVQEITNALDGAVTQSGEKLVALSSRGPVLLVFLRHAGCTFCRQALSDIAATREIIERSSTRIVIVHMGDHEAVDRLLVRYGLTQIDRISDPQQRLYRVFGLKRGTLRQLFGMKVLWRGLRAAFLEKHGIGKPTADSTQMPGVFLLADSVILNRFRHRSAADRPDYAAICAAFTASGAQ